jgi:hypothetical protein
MSISRSVRLATLDMRPRKDTSRRLNALRDFAFQTAPAQFLNWRSNPYTVDGQTPACGMRKEQIGTRPFYRSRAL